MISFQSCFLIALITLTINIQLIFGNSSWDPKKTPYPYVKQINKTFSFASARAGKNVTLIDPYYWLEAPLETDPAVKKFITEQTLLTETYMRKCKSKSIIKETVESAFSYNVINDMYFFDGDTEKYPIYIYSLKKQGEIRPTWYLASPDEMEIAQKTNFAKPPGKPFLNETFLSPNGTASIQYIDGITEAGIFGYMVQELNSDVGTWYFRNFSSPLLDPSKPIIEGGYGRLNDSLPFGTGDIKDTPDGKGVFYVQTQDSRGGYNTNQGNAIRYHKFGTPYENDVTLIHPEPDVAEGVSVQWGQFLSADGRWLIVMGEVDVSQHARVYATLLTDQKISDKMKWISISPDYSSTYGIFQVINDIAYFTTDANTLDGKIAKVELDWSKARQFDKTLNELTDRAKVFDVVPEKPLTTVVGAAPIGGDRAIALYTDKGRYTVSLFNLETGELVEKLLPNELSNVQGIFTTGGREKSLILFYENLLTPLKIVRVTCQYDGQCETVVLTTQVIQGVKDTDYVTESLFAISKDGTAVPYFVTSRKGTPHDGTGFALMHIYGSYDEIENFLWRPFFFAYAVSYNGVFVWGSPRGGGDEGEKWHEMGQRHLKQNTFDDIIAISEDLVKRKIIAQGQLGIDGGSAGGLAALVVANQAPANTYGAVLPGRPVCDYVLRRRSRGGADQIDEFGDVYNATDFDYILDWSPYQNIKTQEYPAILFTPGTGDDRVVAAHSFKCLAKLQALNPNNPNPLLMHLVSGGHTVNYLDTDASVSEAVHQLCAVETSLGLTNIKAKRHRS